MSYTIIIKNLRPEELSEEKVRENLKEETLELDEYGDVEKVEFDGNTATVTMSGETEEVRSLMDGRVYDGLYD